MMDDVPMDETEKKIVNSLFSCANDLIRERITDTPTWTARMMMTLQGLGRGEERGFIVRWSGSKSEWLWDLTWLKGEIAENGFGGVALACEIEWYDGDKERVFDFLKLTACDCDHRLFVFWVTDGTKLEPAFNKLKLASQAVVNRRYLAVGFADTCGPQDQASRTWEVK